MATFDPNLPFSIEETDEPSFDADASFEVVDEENSEFFPRLARGVQLGVEGVFGGVRRAVSDTFRGMQNPYIGKSTDELNAEVPALEEQIRQKEQEYESIYPEGGAFVPSSQDPIGSTQRAIEIAALKKKLGQAKEASRGVYEESFAGSLSRAAGDLAEESAEKSQAIDEKYKGKISPYRNDEFWNQVADSLGQSAPSTAASVLNPALGLAMMYGQTYEGAREEYVQSKKQQGLPVNEDEAAAYATQQAAMQTPLEIVGDVAVAKTIGRSLAGLFKGKPTASAISKWVMDKAKDLGESIAGETLITTPGQVIGEQLMAQEFGVREEKSAAEIAKDTFKQMRVAAVQAGLMAGPSIAAEGTVRGIRGDFKAQPASPVEEVPQTFTDIQPPVTPPPVSTVDPALQRKNDIIQNEKVIVTDNLKNSGSYQASATTDELFNDIIALQSEDVLQPARDLSERRFAPVVEPKLVTFDSPELQSPQQAYGMEPEMYDVFAEQRRRPVEQPAIAESPQESALVEQPVYEPTQTKPTGVSVEGGTQRNIAEVVAPKSDEGEGRLPEPSVTGTSQQGAVATQRPELTDENAEILRDIIKLRKSQGKPVAAEQEQRLAEYDAKKAGVQVESGDIVSNLVVGNPLIESPQVELNNLIPIKVKRGQSIDNKFKDALAIKEKALAYIGGYSYEQSKAKTASQKKAFAKKYNSSELARQKEILEYLNKEVFPELERIDAILKPYEQAPTEPQVQGEREVPVSQEEVQATAPEGEVTQEWSKDEYNALLKKDAQEQLVTLKKELSEQINMYGARGEKHPSAKQIGGLNPAARRITGLREKISELTSFVNQGVVKEEKPSLVAIAGVNPKSQKQGLMYNASYKNQKAQIGKDSKGWYVVTPNLDIATEGHKTPQQALNAWSNKIKTEGLSDAIQKSGAGRSVLGEQGVRGQGGLQGAAVQDQGQVTQEGKAEEKGIVGKRVRKGSTPAAWRVLEVLPQTETERANDEQFVTVQKEDKDGNLIEGTQEEVLLSEVKEIGVGTKTKAVARKLGKKAQAAIKGNEAPIAGTPNLGDTETNSDEAIAAQLEEAGELGLLNDEVSIPAVLEKLGNNKAYKPWVRQIAKVLAKVAPPNVSIEISYRPDENFAALFITGEPNRVVFNLAKGHAAVAQNLLHELAHAISLQTILNYKNGTGNLTPRQKSAVKRLESIFNDIKKSKAFAGDYGITNVDEMIGEAFSSPAFKRKLEQHGFLRCILVAIGRLFNLDIAPASKWEQVINLTLSLGDTAYVGKSNLKQYGTTRVSDAGKAGMDTGIPEPRLQKLFQNYIERARDISPRTGVGKPIAQDSIGLLNQLEPRSRGISRKFAPILSSLEQSGVVVFGHDGRDTFVQVLADGTIALQFGLGSERSAPAERIESLLNEEVIHAIADIGVRTLWEKGGKQGSFADFRNAAYTKAAEQLFSKADEISGIEGDKIKNLIRSVYATYFAPDSSIQDMPSYVDVRAKFSSDPSVSQTIPFATFTSELARQVVQLRVQGDITESTMSRVLSGIAKWFNTALEYLKTGSAELKSGVLAGTQMQSLIDYMEKEYRNLSSPQMRASAPTSQAAELDAAYMQAVESGDMPLVQRMVDAAAKAAGYIYKGYHGRKTDWTQAKVGEGRKVYFTDNPELAQEYSYTRYGPKGIELMERYDEAYAELNEVMKGRLNDFQRVSGWTDRVLSELNRLPITRDQYDKAYSAFEVLEEAEKYQGYDDGESNVVSAFVKGDKIKRINAGRMAQIAINPTVDSLIEGGYDLVIVDEAVDPSFEGGNETPSTLYIVGGSPSQIKSAEAITRDEQGNIVPLSQRFNPESPKIYASAPASEGVETVFNEDASDAARVEALSEVQDKESALTRSLRVELTPEQEKLVNDTFSKGWVKMMVDKYARQNPRIDRNEVESMLGIVLHYSAQAWNPERSTFNTFATRIADSQFVNISRKASRRGAKVGTESEAGPTEEGSVIEATAGAEDETPEYREVKNATRAASEAVIRKIKSTYEGTRQEWKVKAAELLIDGNYANASDIAKIVGVSPASITGFLNGKFDENGDVTEQGFFSMLGDEIAKRGWTKEEIFDSLTPKERKPAARKKQIGLYDEEVAKQAAAPRTSAEAPLATTAIPTGVTEEDLRKGEEIPEEQMFRDYAKETEAVGDTGISEATGREGASGGYATSSTSQQLRGGMEPTVRPTGSESIADLIGATGRLRTLSDELDKSLSDLGVRVVADRLSRAIDVAADANGGLILRIRKEGLLGATQERVEEILREEAIHTASYLTHRAEWEKSGKQVNFIQFLQNQSRAMLEDLVDSGDPFNPAESKEIIDAVVQAFNAYHIDDPSFVPANTYLEVIERMASGVNQVTEIYQLTEELIRQVVQKNRRGKITEEKSYSFLNKLREWTEKAIAAISNFASKLKSGSYLGTIIDSHVKDVERTIDSNFSKLFQDGEDVSDSTPEIRASAPVSEADAEYLKLAQDPEKNRGVLQRMVENAAYKAGFQTAVEHGTGKDFTEFDRSKSVKGIYDLNSFGIWTTEVGLGKTYGPKQLSLYGKMKNPMRYPDIGGWQNWWQDYIQIAYPQAAKKVDYDASEREQSDQFNSAIKLLAEKHFNKIGDKTPSVYSQKYRDWLNASFPGADAYRAWLLDNGYDGVQMDGDFVDGELQTVRIYLNSNQLKSAETVTYDDNGNIIPLSQRFNPATPDIRASAPTREGEETVRSEYPAEYLDPLTPRGRKTRVPIFKQKTGPYKAGGTLTAEGKFDRPTFELLKTKEQNIRAEANKAEIIVNKLHEAIKQEYTKKKIEIPEETINRALGNLDNKFTKEQDAQLKTIKDDPEAYAELRDQFLEDNIAAFKVKQQEALESLPVKVQEAVLAMREGMSELSKVMIAEGMIPDNMVATFKRNDGTYLHRSYAIFDGPKWADFVRSNDPEAIRIRNRAVSLFTNYARAQKAVEYFKQQKADGNDVTMQDALDYVENMDVSEEVDGMLADYISVGEKDDSIAYMRGSLPGKKGGSILKIRGQIPSEIRELWGQYNSADINFLKSYISMSSYIEKHRFLKNMLKQGLDAGYLWQQGVSERSTPPPAFVQLYPDTESYNPMAGVYGPPMLRDALQEYSEATQQDWYSAIVMTAMAMKTVYSVASTVRNFLGNPAFAIANGNIFFVSQYGPALKASWDNFRKKAEGQRAKEVERAIRLGVFGDNVGPTLLAELSKASVDLSRGDGGIANFLKNTEKIRKKVASTFGGVYSGVDDFWKFFNWKAETEKILWAKPEMSRADAEQHAATIVRKVVPTYSESYDFVRRVLKKRAGKFIAPFITFTTEVIRVTGNLAEVAAAELQDPNPNVKKIGAARVAGMLAVMTIPVMVSALSKWRYGYDEDDEEALRLGLPDWQKDATILWLPKDAKGNPRFIDFSYLNPYNYFQDAINAAMRAVKNGETPVQAGTNAIKAASSSLAQPFLSEQLATGVFLDWWRNQKANGTPVYNEQESGEMKAIAIGTHIASAFVPGTVDSLVRITKGAIGYTERSGRTYDLITEIMAPISGQRVATYDMQRTLEFQASRFNAAKADSMQIINGTLKDKGTIILPWSISYSYNRANDAMYRNLSQMRRQYLAAIKLGLTPAQATAALKEKEVGEAYIQQIKTGIFRKIQPTTQTLNEVKTIDPARIPELKKAMEQVPDTRPMPK